MTDGGLPPLDCGKRLRCDLVAGHLGPCWSGQAEHFLGLVARCYAVRHGRAESVCWRAAGHDGAHEDGHGRTWRRNRAQPRTKRTVTVRLDGELLRQARRLARAEGVTLSTWLRHAAQGVVLREVARERGILE